MGFIIAAAVAAAVIAFCFLCYKKAPPTQAIVVTGFGLSRPKVVCGRGVFVLPIVQRADRLNMRLLKIDVKTPETGVKTKEGVSLRLDSVVTVQVYSENSTVSDEEVRNAGYDDIRKYINSRQQSAISNFLGMDEAHINEKINDVLQGNLREIVSEMTVDRDPDKPQADGRQRRGERTPRPGQDGLGGRDLQRAGRQGRRGRHGPQPRRY